MSTTTNSCRIRLRKVLSTITPSTADPQPIHTERSTTMCREVTCKKCSKPTCAGHPREAGSGLLNRFFGRAS